MKKAFRDLGSGFKKIATEDQFPEDLKYLDAAMAIKIKDNARQIVEQEQNKKRSKLLAEEQRLRNNDPKRYGGLIRGPRTRLVDVRTPWKNLFETPRTEYDEALEELENTPKNKYYW
jgi:lipopolysaccharide export LptBFGC system permease protein LptF